MREETRSDRKRLDMSGRDGGLWENVGGRKHVVVAIYRVREVEDVDDLFVPSSKGCSTRSRRDFGFEGVRMVIDFRGSRSR